MLGGIGGRGSPHPTPTPIITFLLPLPPQAEEEPPPTAEVKEEEEEGDALWDTLETVPTPLAAPPGKRAKKRKSSGL